MKLKNANAVAISVAVLALGIGIMWYVADAKSIFQTIGGFFALIGGAMTAYFGIHELKK